MSAPDVVVPDPERRVVDVLVVEDSPEVTQTMVRVLLEAGYTLHTVSDGRAALDLVTEYRYRAIICDLAMPIMGGMQFFRELQAKDPAQSENVLFVTGSADSPETIAFIRIVRRVVLRKPYALKELVRLVAALVDR